MFDSSALIVETSLHLATFCVAPLLSNVSTHRSILLNLRNNGGNRTREYSDVCN
jgi:hypothetical protein